MDRTQIRICKWEAVTAILGGMCFIRVLTYVTELASENESGMPLPIAPELLFFLLVSFAFLINSSMMVLNSFTLAMYPEERAGKLHKSLFEVLLYGCGSILYCFATIVLIVYFFFNPAEKEWTYKSATFIVIIIFSIHNTVGYGIACYASEKSRRMMLFNRPVPSNLSVSSCQILVNQAV